jgi:hypothetical protein
MTHGPKLAALAVALGALATAPAVAQDTDMSFFVTSAGSGDGGNLGGLEGADAHCQALAEAAGAGGKTWRAYLSTQGEGAVNARDRIGAGPWRNAKGDVIAADLDALHQESVNLNADTALDETGEAVPFVKVDDAGTPLPLDQQSGVEHDILTGTQADGTAFAAGEDRTCSNWTSNADGAAMVGHHDRRSLQPGVSPWSAAHPSAGCSQQSLVNTGGAGRLNCSGAD